LVLDWGDGSGGDPVDIVWKVVGWELLSSLHGLVGHGWSVSEHLGHLFLGLVGELVESNGGGSVLGVVLSNLGEGLLELGSSELELSLGSIGFSVFGNVSDELVVLSGHKLRGEELGSSWGLVVKGNDGKGSGGSESSDGSLGSHVD